MWNVKLLTFWRSRYHRILAIGQQTWLNRIESTDTCFKWITQCSSTTIHWVVKISICLLQHQLAIGQSAWCHEKGKKIPYSVTSTQLEEPIDDRWLLLLLHIELVSCTNWNTTIMKWSANTNNALPMMKWLESDPVHYDYKFRINQ